MHTHFASRSALAASTAARRPARWRAALMFALLLGPALFVAAPPAPAGAATVFPPYVYVVTSGPYSFDVLRSAGGKDSRVARVAVAGIGLSDVSAKIAPDGGHVAVRVTGDRNGGSSLRLYAIGSTRGLTVTLSHSDAIGLGAFAWSPDSKSLAYTVASPERADADSGAGVLWVVGADGRGAYRVKGPSNARLIGWSPDGSSLLYGRDADQDGTTEDLWLQPLAGPATPLLRSSPGGLQYSLFAVAPTLVAKGGPGAAHVAALAAGDLSMLPAPGAAPANVPRSRPAPHVVPLTAPGVIAGDGLGGYGALHDAGEPYTVLAWDPTGTHLLLSGGKSKSAWYADANTGKRWHLPAAANGMAPIAWSPDGDYVLLAPASGPATTLVSFDLTSGALLRTRWPGNSGGASTPVTDLPLPYISQNWDTGSGFNGNWACGPTTTAMVLAYYGRLTPWPFAAGQARTTSHSQLQVAAAGVNAAQPNLLDGRNYGQYVTTAFSYNGHSFAASGLDASGHRAQGLYGTIVGNTTLADWGKMTAVLGLYNLSTAYIPATWGSITAMLDKGNPVVLGTTLTTSGHILVARGYTANGYLLVDDPYGNRFGPAGYGSNDGGDVAYAWKRSQVKLAMVVRGTITPPAPPAPPTVIPTPDSGVLTGHGVNP